MTSCKRVLCHFYHNDFERCKIYDQHLRVIAHEHLETRFITINVEKAPFFVEKLAIKVLPSLIYFEDGISKTRVIGFEGVSEVDDFPTVLLSRHLVNINCIEAKNKAEEGRTTTKMKGGKHENWSDDDSD